jgi:hypothetical protein
MSKYEYQIVYTEYVLLNERELDANGLTGWELCAMWRENSGRFIYYFKRAIKDGT